MTAPTVQHLRRVISGYGWGSESLLPTFDALIQQSERRLSDWKEALRERDDYIKTYEIAEERITELMRERDEARAELRQAKGALQEKREFIKVYHTHIASLEGALRHILTLKDAGEQRARNIAKAALAEPAATENVVPALPERAFSGGQGPQNVRCPTCGEKPTMPDYGMYGDSRVWEMCPDSCHVEGDGEAK